MKRLLLSALIVIASAMAVSAASTFKTLSAFKNKTTVVVEVDSVSSKNPILTYVVFHNDGKAYECKELKSIQNDGSMTICAGFKKFKKFDRCYISFILNGRSHKVVVVPD